VENISKILYNYLKTDRGKSKEALQIPSTLDSAKVNELLHQIDSFGMVQFDGMVKLRIRIMHSSQKYENDYGHALKLWFTPTPASFAAAVLNLWTAPHP
jgi:hypothetical protein